MGHLETRSAPLHLRGSLQTMLVDAPVRQNASVMHTTISSRSNAGDGWLNRALVIS